MNRMKRQNPMPMQNPQQPMPKSIITKYLSDAQSTANSVKDEINKFYGKHAEGQLDDEERKFQIKRVRPFVRLAVEKSTLALNKVPGITSDDAKDIEEDIKLMKDAFETEYTSMLNILNAKMAADRLQIMWEYSLEHLDMEKIEKKLGSYAMGQLVGSAKGGKRTRRNRKHKRTHRNRKHKRTQRK